MSEFKQTWRVVSLALLILALTGPWAYDVINVPAEYSCDAPFVRLEGDYCGMPLAGIQVILYLVEAFIPLSIALLTGTEVFAERAREYFFILITLLPIFPLLSTPLVIWKKDSRPLYGFHLAVWGLATIVALYWSVIIFSDPHPDNGRWGVWIYIALAISVLIAEMSLLVPQNGSGKT